MTVDDLGAWGELCGWALARGHARSGEPATIAGYLGEDDAFDRAMGAFAETYADQTERDFATFRRRSPSAGSSPRAGVFFLKKKLRITGTLRPYARGGRRRRPPSTDP